MKNKKTILTCAVTGNIHTREQNINIPVTPYEISMAVLESELAGAAIAHIHVRDIKTALGTMDIGMYQEVLDRVRTSGSNIILNLTTGEGGRFVPSREDPAKPDFGTTLCKPELRVEHIPKLKPEICTLDFNTMNSGANVVINTPRNLEIMAEIINQANVLPEIEIFDSGDLNLALSFYERGILKGPLLFNFVLGVKYGAAADVQTLVYLTSRLPKNAQWTAFGIGSKAFPMLAASYVAGGHVRIGLEDTLYISKGNLAKNNKELVEKAVDIIQKLGGEIATPDEAREILNLKIEV